MKGLRDWLQDRRIDTVQDRSSHAIGVARSGQHATASQQRQIDELQLMVLATAELLEEVGFDRRRLIDKMDEIDRRDGKADGRYLRCFNCAGCGRRLAKRQTRCCFCGERLSLHRQLSRPRR